MFLVTANEFIHRRFEYAIVLAPAVSSNDSSLKPSTIPIVYMSLR